MSIDLLPHALIPSLLSLWAGVIVGVSLVAQPAKFSTPGLSRSVALAVGRQMFHATHRAECALAAAALLLTLWAGWPSRLLVLAAALILLFQVALLMPTLSRRVDAVLAGHTLAPSRHHLAFAALELGKLLLLTCSALLSLPTT